MAVDGSSVQNIDHIRIADGNGTLSFPPFSSKEIIPEVHDGVYRCIATNRIGSIRSPDIRVNAVQLQEYQVQLHDNHVMRGNTAVFKCNVPRFVKDYVNVTAWTRESSLLQSEGRFSVLPSGELHIRDVRDRDAGQYRCTVRNRLTNNNKVSPPAVLHVAEPVNTAPELIQSKSDFTLRVGETVELPCVASGYPLPTYQWSKDGALITPGDTRSFRGGNLLLSNVQLDNAGRYDCEAVNELGTVSTTRNVIVRDSIAVYFYPQKRSVDVGAFATFNCSVSGYPIEQVTWYKNAQPLDGDDRVTVYENGTMVVAGMRRDDRGMYQCVATNSWQTQEATMQLSLGAAKPIMLAHFTNQTLQPGPNLQLSCTVAGNPTPDVTWLRDGLAIPTDHRYTFNDVINEDSDVISYLNISRLVSEDGGLYRCEATSVLGAVQHEDRINVIGRPLVRPLPDVIAIDGTDVSIHCHVVGFPITSITWYKGLTTLPSSMRHTVFPNGTLVIADVTSYGDGGEYTCVASNARGDRSASDMDLIVKVPPVIQPIEPLTLRQGQRTQLMCIVTRGDLPIHFRWLKDGEAIPHGVGIEFVNGTFSSSLVIADASTVHDGRYTCEASNLAAAVNYTTALTIQVPPRFVVEPHNTAVVLNHTVVIACMANGKPNPDVQWKKAPGPTTTNFRDLPDDPRFEMQENGSLVIREARVEDAGYYLCHISNSVGMDSKTATLTVFVPATFEQQQQNVTVELTESITLECTATGHQPLEIMWSKNDVPFNRLSTSRYDIETVTDGDSVLSSMTIFSAVRDDTATYICLAQNLHGADEHVIQLWVQEKPEPPTDLHVVNKTSRGVLLSWQPAFDGNSPVTGFTLEYKNASDAWQTGLPQEHVPADLIGYQYSIKHLHPAYTYHVRIFAFNAIGISDPSKEILFDTEEEAPSGIPLNIEIDALTSQSIQITWRQPRADLQNGFLLGYHIQYRDPHSPFQSRIVPVETNYIESRTLTNLKKFTRYTIQLRAYNRVNVGPWSPQQFVTTLEDVPSEAPHDVSARSVGSTNIMVFWNAPDQESLNGILQGYRVYYRPIREHEDELDYQIYETTELFAELHNLQKFTNYSISVVAHTRVGEGVRSEEKIVRTEQDVPEAPADIKAHAASPTSIMVSWLPPLYLNGIITHYHLNIQYREGENEVRQEKELDPTTFYYLVEDLQTDYEYDFWVKASTIAGQGESSRIATEIPMSRVPARIMSFSTTLMSPWKRAVTLDCLPVGDPVLTVEWKKNRLPNVLKPDGRVDILENGSLVIKSVQSTDAGNYTCRAINEYGSSDSITVRVQVLAPPNPPQLTIGSTSNSAIKVNWRSTGNGGSSIVAFQLFYQRTHEQTWERYDVNASLRSYRATDLLCGTGYRFYITARNKLGVGKPSDILSVSTQGEIPIPPSTDKIVPFTNASSITLVLASWQSGGCPIESYSIQYQVLGQDDWENIANNLPGNTRDYTVDDLRPLTWYQFRVTAVNTAGPSVYPFRVSTVAFSGSGTAPPIKQITSRPLAFYEDPRLFGPILGILTLFVILGFISYFIHGCRRRRKKAVKSQHVVVETLSGRESNGNSPSQRNNNNRPTVHLPPEREPFLGAYERAETVAVRQTPWIFNADEEEGDYASEPRRHHGLADPYATFDYHDGSIYPSMSTFRSDGSSGSLSDCGVLMHDERLYDIPPEEIARRGYCRRYHTYARLDDVRPSHTGSKSDGPGSQADSSSSPSRGNKRPSNGSLSTTNESSNREELERAYSTGMRIEAAQFELIQCANKKREDYSPASSSSRSHASRDHPTVTNSDIEHGIRNFTASPPMPTLPETNHYAPRRYVHTLEGARPRDRARMSLTTSPSLVRSSEESSDVDFEVESSERGSIHVYRPSRYRSNRRVPRRGYVTARSVIRAARVPGRKHRHPSSHQHARHHRGTPSSSSPETVRSHPIHYRAPSSPSEGYISLPYDSFSAAHSGVTDSDAEPRKHYGYYRRRGRPQIIWTPSDTLPPGSISDPERGRHLRHMNPKRHATSVGGVKVVHPIHPETVRYHIPSEIREEGESPKKEPRSCKPLMITSYPSPPPPPPPPPSSLPPKRRGSPEGNEQDVEEDIEIQVIDECSKASPIGDQLRESISVV
ncbi:Down syndrome cell adhesion molecule homolog isoform X2 [Lytechinus variegatus]|uniref:Down syndrome cell adhesion molecule homolog isoform X2 n=1 Tax=Lytechinus variegatus TaxID=7654 RepID=UPI001BB22B2A|nr:Down syndrome cell adhesion molecule homolog isoform X2 [Lytechinus variegatus]